MMNLVTPQTVQKLQTALHAKAKDAPNYRFYAIYDKVYRADVLAFAYRCCRANHGEAGVDGETFAAIEASGVEQWLGVLTAELRTKTYRPRAVRRRWRRKPGGGRRPLGVPTVRDRVVQMAVVLVLGPIFEAGLPPEQYAYRRGKSALDAVQHVQALLKQGYTEVVDADLSGYFDTIPHTELLKSVARRVSDKHVLHLVKMWLETPVEETVARGQTVRTTRNRDEHRGTPQGAVISPLLANLYMGRFLLGWQVLGHERRWSARIVNYADDFVICCRGTAAPALAAMQAMMVQLRLTVNPTKTRTCRVQDERFDFLGYTFGRWYRYVDGQPYLGVRPSVKAVRRVMRAIHAETTARTRGRSLAAVIVAVNRVVRGWANYFRRGAKAHAYRVVDGYARERLRQWWRGKHQVRTWATRLSAVDLHVTHGLLRLQP